MLHSKSKNKSNMNLSSLKRVWNKNVENHAWREVPLPLTLMKLKRDQEDPSLIQWEDNQLMENSSLLPRKLFKFMENAIKKITNQMKAVSTTSLEIKRSISQKKSEKTSAFNLEILCLKVQSKITKKKKEEGQSSRKIQSWRIRKKKSVSLLQSQVKKNLRLIRKPKKVWCFWTTELINLDLLINIHIQINIYSLMISV